jgi:aconitate hydratase
MEPRFLGVKPYWLNHLLVSTRQTLKTRGLIFDNESDYDKIQENDTINFTDLVDFSGKPLTLEFVHEDEQRSHLGKPHLQRRANRLVRRRFSIKFNCCWKA